MTRKIQKDCIKEEKFPKQLGHKRAILKGKLGLMTSCLTVKSINTNKKIRVTSAMKTSDIFQLFNQPRLIVKMFEKIINSNKTVRKFKFKDFHLYS